MMAMRLSERNARSQEMVQLFKGGKTLEQIGNVFGLSRERVRQILDERGVDSSQGGIAVQMRRKAESIKHCEAPDCERKAKENSTYCHWHKEQIEVYGKFGCLIDGCNKDSISWGMCKNHSSNFYQHRRQGNVKDLNDFLNVQLAKKIMGKKKVPFSDIRKFMDGNSELFESFEGE